MRDEIEKPDRKLNRLSEFDYALPGYYFVTICTLQRKKILSIINDCAVSLNKAGEICLQVWHSLPGRYSAVKLDEVVIMPNHIHGIIVIEDVPESPSLSAVVGAFKSISARMYFSEEVGEDHSSKRRFWQRSFHDHVIRNEGALYAIRKYIQENPMNWEKDPENW